MIKLAGFYASANTKAVPDLVNPTPVAGPSSPTAQSSVPAGTILRGIGYHQDRPEPVALPDEEYPSWLWKLLETSPQAGVQPQGPANKATKVVPQSSTADGFQATVRTRDGPVHINKRGLRQKNREDIKVRYRPKRKVATFGLNDS
ncbi:hypothetical protein EMMF5_000131 [Cystobasidiomycetes sp. EMM_F5]